jgi:hypothetical protein
VNDLADCFQKSGRGAAGGGAASASFGCGRDARFPVS